MKLKKILAGFLMGNVVMTAIPSDFRTVSAAELPDPVMQVTFDAEYFQSINSSDEFNIRIGFWILDAKKRRQHFIL